MLIGLIGIPGNSTFAAQGQITEVNPSGVHGVVSILGTGDLIRFTTPRPAEKLRVGDAVTFEIQCLGRTINSCFAIDIRLKEDPCDPTNPDCDPPGSSDDECGEDEELVGGECV